MPLLKKSGSSGPYLSTLFIENKGSTLLEVDVDIDNDYRSYFDTAWPEALAKLKEICERKVNDKE